MYSPPTRPDGRCIARLNRSGGADIRASGLSLPAGRRCSALRLT
jgi:hypothetical protein